LIRRGGGDGEVLKGSLGHGKFRAREVGKMTPGIPGVPKRESTV